MMMQSKNYLVLTANIYFFFILKYALLSTSELPKLLFSKVQILSGVF